MCVMTKQFELLEFFFNSVYFDLQYDEISLTFTAGYVSLWCVCSHVVVFGVCEVVVIHAVVSVVGVTVMRVLLFVLHVCMQRECVGARVTEILMWGWMRCGCCECRACWWYTGFMYCV